MFFPMHLVQWWLFDKVKEKIGNGQRKFSRPLPIFCRLKQSNMIRFKTLVAVLVITIIALFTFQYDSIQNRIRDHDWNCEKRIYISIWVNSKCYQAVFVFVLKTYLHFNMSQFKIWRFSFYAVARLRFTFQYESIQNQNRGKGALMGTDIYISIWVNSK